MQKQTLDHNEIQESVFSNELRSQLSDVLGNYFFTHLGQEGLGIEGYRLLLKEKYSSIAYFIDFLENVQSLAEPISTNLAKVCKDNKQDELGYFSGEIRHEYQHETWRLRSLKSFGISEEDLQNHTTLPTTREHAEIMIELSRSENTYAVIGGLLFLELFVVYEMKSLIAAFERDLPSLFPLDGYSYDRMPFNTQEYWYGHALHDTWHYRSIEESLLEALEQSPHREEDLASLYSGFKKVARAKNLLYSKELLENMRATS